MVIKYFTKVTFNVILPWLKNRDKGKAHVNAGISGLAEERLPPQEGGCSVELLKS
jgi:hypothetical protein